MHSVLKRSDFCNFLETRCHEPWTLCRDRDTLDPISNLGLRNGLLHGRSGRQSSCGALAGEGSPACNGQGAGLPSQPGPS